MRKRERKISWVSLLFPLVMAAVLLWFSGSITNLSQGRKEEARLQLEDAVRKAAVACYAAEGFYPPDLEYLQQHYGVQIDEKNYAVFYQAFGTNLMPDITVVEQ